MSAAVKPTWDGVFATFAEAGGEAAVFESPLWMDKVVARARAARDGAKAAGAIAPVALTTDYTLVSFAAAIAKRTEPLRILDFGGGMATTYVPVRAILPAAQPLEFVVVENAAIVARGQELFADDPGVRFRTDLPSPPERFAIIHFGSSLQYIDDWKALIASAIALGPEFLVFADLPAGDNRSFVSIQQWHERRIPVHLWNVDDFVAAVEALGYGCVMRARYRGYYLAVGAELATDNFDPDHRLTYTSQLVFRRGDPI